MDLELVDFFMNFSIVVFIFGYIHVFGFFSTFRIRCRFHFQKGTGMYTNPCTRTRPLKMESATDSKRREKNEDTSENEHNRTYFP